MIDEVLNNVLIVLQEGLTQDTQRGVRQAVRTAIKLLQELERHQQQEVRKHDH